MIKWLTFIKERFSPLQYIPMIAVFLLANVAYITRTENYSSSSERLILTFVLLLSFFFRMRCFDEIKDYEVDLKVNPTRPLARGLLKVSEVKIAIYVLMAFEVLLALILGLQALFVHTVALLYSLLMYKEFFVGEKLRPHLTTYAITHTFVVVLLSISATVAANNFEVQNINEFHLAFFLMNWAFFNLFEFARKTFALSEERPHVPTYSNIFGPRGAYLLTLKEVLVGIVLLVAATRNPLFGDFKPLILAITIATVLYTLISALYFFKPSPPFAKIFRASSGVYLLAHYLILAVML